MTRPSNARTAFFTAINFFNDAPDTNLFDHTYAKTILDNEFLPASGQPTYGDLVAVSGHSGAVIHLCVYIAKDFVFTKNGLDCAQPGVLMRMTDMLRCYCVPAMPRRVILFRRAVLKQSRQQKPYMQPSGDSSGRIHRDRVPTPQFAACPTAKLMA